MSTSDLPSPLPVGLLLHISLAILVWAVLMPLSHLFGLYLHNNLSPSAFYFHKLLMISGIALTCLLVLLGIFNRTTTPSSTHQLLTGILTIALIFQASLGIFRPDKTHSLRHIWKRVHGLWGSSVMMFGAYIVFHSMDVFHVQPVQKLTVKVLVSTMITAVLIARLVYTLRDKENLRFKQQGERITNDDTDMEAGPPQTCEKEETVGETTHVSGIE